MKIALFTSNQVRHQSLINKLSEIAKELFVVCEGTTIFPGQTQDFYNKSDVMQKYFSKMQQAEEKVFGSIGFLNKNVRLLPIKMGDVNSLPLSWLKDLEDVDYAIVFGASWIKGELCDFLIKKKAVNIHMGISPYYRGAACNFWALYDKKPELVGATLHYLSKGLDSGSMILHALPKPQLVDGFELGMLAVRSAQIALVFALKEGSLFKFEAQSQNKSLQLRYSKRIEFNDEVAFSYLTHPLSKEYIHEQCAQRNMELFLRPHVA